MLVHNDLRADTRVMREASVLGASGWSVTVLCLQSEDLPQEERRDHYEVRRVARASSAGWRRPLRKVAESRQRTAAMVAAAISVRPDVVHCHDSDTLPAGVRIAKATGARLVYDAHELFPDMLAGHGRASAPVQRYWRSVERRAVPRADLVITVNESRARVLSERYGVGAGVIRNVPELEPEVRTDRLRRELGIPADTAVVLYQGGLIGGRALVRLVRSMEHVPDAVLVLQGAGAEEAAIRREVQDRGLVTRVRLTGWVPPGELHEYACSADVGVVIYENISLNNYYAAPNKLYSYLMAGLPMVASDFAGLAEVVKGEGVGEVFDPADERSIAAAINSLLSDRVRREGMGRTARGLAETRYNWELESARLSAVYAGMIGEK